jgi:PleD family two-component response regulator
LAVEAHAFDIGNGTPLRCTVSIGVAACPDHATEPPGLLEQADAALYRAKHTRNAVCGPRDLHALAYANGARVLSSAG